MICVPSIHVPGDPAIQRHVLKMHDVDEVLLPQGQRVVSGFRRWGNCQIQSVRSFVGRMFVGSFVLVVHDQRCDYTPNGLKLSGG